MVRLGSYRGTDQLPGVRVPQAQVSSAIGDNLQRAGNQIARAGFEQAARLQKKQQELDNFKMQSGLLDFSAAQNQRMLDAQQNMQPGAEGFTPQYMKGFKEDSEKFINSLPESVRNDARLRVQSLGNKFLNSASRTELKELWSFYETETDRQKESLRASLQQNPEAFEDVLANGQALEDANGLPPAIKDQRNRAFKRSVALALGNEMAPADLQKYLKARNAASSQMRDGIVETANSLGIDPVVLATVISYETGGTMDPTKRGPTTKWGTHKGLIQFGEPQAKRYGVDWNNPVASQLGENGAIAKYLRDAGVKPGMGLLDVYSAINAGSVGRYDASDAAAGGAPGTVRDKVASMGAHQKKAEQLINSGSHSIMGALDAREANLDPQIQDLFSSLTYDDLTKLEKGAAIDMRSHIENVASDAPAAMQQFGEYSGDIPSEDEFITAYGATDGPEKRADLLSAMDTGKTIYDMKTMSREEIEGAVQDATPTNTGDQAREEIATYNTLSKAAQATLAAREKDPAGYVQQAFPEVASAWEGAQDQQGLGTAINKSIAAQRMLGIQNLAPLPATVSARAVQTFGNAEASNQRRYDAVSQLVFSAKDNEAQSAVLKQLVDAGVSPMIEGVIEATARGDQGAANRLLEAVLVDPKDLPKSTEETAATIRNKIYEDVWSDGSIGYSAYGLSFADAGSLDRVARATDLMDRAVSIRMTRGESLNDAVEGAKKDMFGDVKTFTGDRRINAELVLPQDADTNQISLGLQQAKPQFRAALEDQKRRIMEQSTMDNAQGDKSVVERAANNRISDIMNNGIFVETDSGIGMRDPYTGQFVTDADGNPVTVSMGSLMEAEQAMTTQEKARAARSRRLSDMQTMAGEAMPQSTGEVLGETEEGRPIVRNADGSVSTERTITVTEDGINNGRPTNIPTMYGGRIVDEATAIQIISDNNGVDPDTGKKLSSFASINEAENAAEARSKALGDEVDKILNKKPRHRDQRGRLIQ